MKVYKRIDRVTEILNKVIEKKTCQKDVLTSTMLIQAMMEMDITLIEGKND